MSSSSFEEHPPLSPLPHKREVHFLELQRISSFPSTKYVPCLLAARENEGREEWIGWLLGPTDVAGLHADSQNALFCLGAVLLHVAWV